MGGETAKKPWFVLTTNRGGAWFFAAFYTVFAGFEVYEGATHGRWWQWLLAVGFVLLSVLGWVSLVWVLRHPIPAPDRTPPSRVEDRDDG